MRIVDDIQQGIESAAELRLIISNLFDIPQPDRIVLSPSILVALDRVLLSYGAHNIAMTPYEYYDAYHFPNSMVMTFDVDKLLEGIERVVPDVVLISLVSWLGKTLPVDEIFREIRRAFGAKSPILIADCAHAGAIGFPGLDTIDADIVCGDICKWITPPEWQRNLAFLWFRSDLIWEKAKNTFRPYYLATEQERKHLLSRWIDPYEVKTVVSWLKEQRLDRARLRRRHERNMVLAKSLAPQLGITEALDSSIIYIQQHEGKTDILLRELEHNGLAWRPPVGGLRILCRSEAQPALSLVAGLELKGR